MKGKGQTKVNLKAAQELTEEDITPLMAGGQEVRANASSTRTRRNLSSSITRTDKFKNIDDGLVPFKYTKGGSNNSNLDVRDAVILCQKAYYNFAVFRNTIDLMTEFSVCDIFLRGGNKKSRDFFKAYFKKIGLWNLQDRFFREYYRSGNVFVYRFDAELQKQDALKITQTFGAHLKDKINLPVRYVILNPADIQIGGSLSFVNGKYYKLVTDYELHRLRNPETEEDHQVLDTLDEQSKETLNKRGNNSVLIPLGADKISAVFYKKQDYEPFAVPMGYPVLGDINWKAELKKMDMAITRTMQQAILLVTMGDVPDRGGVNQKNLAAMQSLFENQSVGRVLIADYTTKAQFIIPDIANLLDPKKYAMVDKDIQIGLNNVLLGTGEKFANQSAQIDVFLSRLKQGRHAFLNDFLIPEIKRVSKILGFKSFPVPEFDKLHYGDESLVARVYTRLIEIGVLTPEEGIRAIEDGRLPSAEESEESQEKYKKLRDKGLYEPITGGPETQMELADKQGEVQKELVKMKPATAPALNKKPSGERGSGTNEGVPQKNRIKTPIGENKVKVAASEGYSLSKVTENLTLASKLNKDVEAELRKAHNIKRLSRKQKEVAESITELIIANEEPKDWNNKKAKSYVKEPVDKNPDRTEKVEEIAAEHQIDPYLASILYASKKD
jgi:hypothetical protein